MARKDGRPEVQHYVPEVLLKNFAVKGSGRELQVHVFDKHTDRQFKTAVGNVVAEKDFYDVKDGAEIVSLEPGLARLEKFAGEALDKLLNKRIISQLSDDDRNWIVLFAAFQFGRVKNYRELIQDADRATQEKIKAMGYDPSNIEGYRPFKDEEDVKKFTLDLLLQSSSGYGALIAAKNWVLFDATEVDPFIIGDNPVVMHNQHEFGAYGNIGLAVRFIEIYMPLAPSLTLGFLCPELVKEIRGRVTDLRKQRQELLVRKVLGANSQSVPIDRMLKLVEMRLTESEAMIAAIDEGRPLPSTTENVMFMNSLQIGWAHRYVMSYRDNFDLAVRMIGDNPARRVEKRKGPEFPPGLLHSKQLTERWTNPCFAPSELRRADRAISAIRSPYRPCRRRRRACRPRRRILSSACPPPSLRW
jgi:hypothetical protein